MTHTCECGPPSSSHLPGPIIVELAFRSDVWRSAYPLLSCDHHSVRIDTHHKKWESIPFLSRSGCPTSRFISSSPLRHCNTLSTYKTWIFSDVIVFLKPILANAVITHSEIIMNSLSSPSSSRNNGHEMQTHAIHELTLHITNGHEMQTHATHELPFLYELAHRLFQTWTFRSRRRFSPREGFRGIFLFCDLVGGVEKC